MSPEIAKAPPTARNSSPHPHPLEKLSNNFGSKATPDMLLHSISNEGKTDSYYILTSSSPTKTELVTVAVMFYIGISEVLGLNLG
jgi:hypothetical protein